MKVKMKDLLEGFAWERESGKPLPTMADVARKHKQNLRTEADAAFSDPNKPAQTSPEAEEDGTNVVSRKFDLIMKEKPQFAKIKKLFGSVSVIKQVDFILYLLDALGSTSDVKKKLKLKL